MVIDGGMSAAYQKPTGSAGFTFVSDAQGISRATHEPVVGTNIANEQNIDLNSSIRPITNPDHPVLVSQTDEGAELEERINDLKQFLANQRAL